eukprot:2356570-Rhodomonas_salina.4
MERLGGRGRGDHGQCFGSGLGHEEMERSVCVVEGLVCGVGEARRKKGAERQGGLLTSDGVGMGKTVAAYLLPCRPSSVLPYAPPACAELNNKS